MAEEVITEQVPEAGQFELAAAFDLVDPVTGPAFAVDHPVIEDEADMEKLLA